MTQIRQFDYAGQLNTTNGYLKANAGINQSPRLMDALNTVLNSQTNSQRQAVDLLEVDEKCAIHKTEQHIAVDDETGVFACNKCVFEKKINKPLFIATFARLTKRKFDEMYEKLLRNITLVEDLTPQLVSQKIQTQIQDFFAAIYLQMKEIERDVLQQVKSSTKLKELASMIETLQLQFDEELLQRLEVERNVLDDKVEHARYGYIVTRKQYYKDLIKEMEGFNIQLSSKIEISNGHLIDLLAVKLDRLQIYDRLYDLVENSVMINNAHIERKAPPPAQELNLLSSSQDRSISPFKTPVDRKMNGRVHDEEMKSEERSVVSGQSSDGENLQLVNTFYTLKGSDIFRTNLSSNITDKLYTVSHCFTPRVAFTQKGRVFLIGGSKTQAQTELLNSNFELVVPRTSGRSTRRRGVSEPELKEKAPMSIARISFGCSVDNYGEKIFVTGGSLGKMKGTDQCEYYSTTEDKWVQLPNLSEPRFTHSTCIFTDQWLFVIGGYGAGSASIKTIERLNLESGKAWEVINAKLPKDLSSVGAFQINVKEIIIFGGYSMDNEKECYFLKAETTDKFGIATEDECKLQDADIFQFNGATRMETEKNAMIVCGQNFIHKFNDKERGFETVKKIE